MLIYQRDLLIDNFTLIHILGIQSVQNYGVQNSCLYFCTYL